MKATSRTPCESSSRARTSPTSKNRAAGVEAAARDRVPDAFARDRVASMLARAAAPLTVALAEAACELVALDGFAPLGYGRMDDFARERLSRSGRWLRELAVLGRALRASSA